MVADNQAKRLTLNTYSALELECEEVITETKGKGYGIYLFPLIINRKKLDHLNQYCVLFCNKIHMDKIYYRSGPEM